MFNIASNGVRIDAMPLFHCSRSEHAFFFIPPSIIAGVAPLYCRLNLKAICIIYCEVSLLMSDE